MGNNWADHYFLSPMQKGRMHRALGTTYLSRYAWGYNETPYVLASDEVWEWPMKFYQDIRVPTGKKLTIKCTIHMVPGSRIIVEPGAQLIIDGGILSCGGVRTGVLEGH